MFFTFEILVSLQIKEISPQSVINYEFYFIVLTGNHLLKRCKKKGRLKLTVVCQTRKEWSSNHALLWTAMILN